MTVNFLVGGVLIEGDSIAPQTLTDETGSTGGKGEILYATGTGFEWATLPFASTGSPGLVQLVDSTSSTSVTEALTANQGYLLQQQIAALSVTSNLTFAGTINGATGLMVTVSTEGALEGFSVGSPLPNPLPANDNYFVIVAEAGTFTPPGGSPTLTHKGDWVLSDGTVWELLPVGFAPAYATTSAEGLITLATDAEVQAGVNSVKAVVPSALQSKISDSVLTTSSTTIASSTAVKLAYDTATAALPLAGGTMTGDISFNNGQPVDAGSF